MLFMTWKLKPGFSMCMTEGLMGLCKAVEEG